MPKGKDFVAYHPRGGESLIDIARTYTLSAAYWEALATYNGAPEWSNVDWKLKPGETVGIPIAWLNDFGSKQGADFGPGFESPVGVDRPVTFAVTGAGGFEYQRNVGWVLFAVGAGLLALMIRGNSKRTRRRR